MTNKTDKTQNAQPQPLDQQEPAKIPVVWILMPVLLIAGAFFLAR